MTPEQFLAFAQIFPEPLLLITGTGHILAVNPPLARMLAMTSDELSTSRVMDIVTNPAEQVRSYLSACARSRAMVLGSLTFQSRNGQPIVCRCEGAVVRPWSKEAPALLLLRAQAKESTSSKFLLLNQKIDQLSGEIRERRQAETEAFRQREQLRVTLSSIGDAVITTDRHGNVSFMNPVAESLTGWSLPEALGHPLSTVFHIINEHSRERVENPVLKVLRENIVVGLANHTVLIAKDGVERPIADSGAPIRDAEGDITGVVLVFRDITEQHQREETQRFLDAVTMTLASSLEYETTLTSVARLTVPFLADWCIVDVLAENETLHRLAITHADPVKEEWASRLLGYYPLDSSALYGISHAIHTGQPIVVAQISEEQLIAAARDDEQLQLLRSLELVSAMIIPLQSRGQIFGALTFLTAQSGRQYGPDDIAVGEELAHRVAQAIDNAKLYQEARAAIRIRDSFISIAAHELRTPLTSLLGNVELLRRRGTREGVLSEPMRRSLQVVTEQSNRLSRMINALLDISRIEAGQLRIEKEPVDLCALTRQVIEEMQSTLDARSVECHTDTEPLLVSGDILRLEQVIQNLLSNAIKYSQPDTSVAIRIEQQGDQVCLSVEDQGMGIPAQDIPNLFQRFFRAKNANEQYISGMGIGLYVVKEIVTLHGGTITVESVENKGSTFRVCLPVAR